MTIRVLLVDDEELVRFGLATILASTTDIEVVGEAGDGAEAVSATRVLRPDVVLMDIRMPRVDGVEATRRITAQAPEVQIRPVVSMKTPTPTVLKDPFTMFT